jgi:hypothetical protein
VSYNPGDLGKNVVKSEVVQNATKGTSFNTPASRFDGIRKLIILEWTPLNEKNQLGQPIRIPFLINPETIDWSRQHVFSQQQTRGGWVHTHWNDKPMTIKLSGQSGNYEYTKIRLLDYAFKVSGKSYLEIKTYQEKKGIDRDRFLSENFGQQDATTIKKLLEDTTLPGQGFFKDFLTNDSLFQASTTLSKDTIQAVKRAGSKIIESKALKDINTDLFIIKQQQQQQSASGGAISSASQTIKGSPTKDTLTPLTDNELDQTFTQIKNVPSNRLSAGLSNINPATSNVDLTLSNSGIQTATLSDKDYMSFPSGLLNSGTGGIASNYNLLRNFLSLGQFNFLRAAQSTIGNFSSKNLRTDNPMGVNSQGNLLSILGAVAGFRAYTSGVSTKLGSLISTFAVDDEVRNKAQELSLLIDNLSINLAAFEDEIIILQRQIKIQSKKLDTHLEAKRYKKVKDKATLTVQSIIGLLQVKSELNALLITPLLTTTSSDADKKLAGNLYSVQSTLTAAQEITQKAKYGSTGDDTFINSQAANSINSLTLQNPGYAQAVLSFNLFKNGNHSINVSSQDVPDFYNYTRTTLVTTQVNAKGEHLNSDALNQDDSLSKNVLLAQVSQKINKSDSISNTDSSIQPTNTDLSANKNIFNPGNFKVTPTTPDIVKLKLYYNGCIYEGFLASFNYHEAAGTPTIRYDLEFIVEREFLGSSLDNIPISIKGNPGSNITYSKYRGDFNPALGNINPGAKPSFSGNNFRIPTLDPGTTAPAPIGSSRPNPNPAPGTIPTTPFNPGINNPNNKVNSTNNNIQTTSDPSNLTVSIADQIAQDLNI